jgi:molybdate transport system regulatory protein
MTSSTPPISPSCKLWMSNPTAEGVFGDGRWRLLSAIREHGSLQQACRELGISYRKAWGDLRKSEEELGITFLEKHRGGSGGGNTSLTEDGERWLQAYTRFRSDVERGLQDAFNGHIRPLLGEK